VCTAARPFWTFGAAGDLLKEPQPLQAEQFFVSSILLLRVV
jgi:hypothetical protein